MAQGDANDMAGRMQAVLPFGWFGSVVPVLSAVLQGIGTQWAALFNLIAYIKPQFRIATATGFNLDIISTDYFGTTLPRNTGESDAAFLARIQAALFAQRGTRQAVIDAATAAAGNAATMIEPNYVYDTGAFDVGTLAFDRAGVWGSLEMPGGFFVTAPLAAGHTAANVYAAINATRPVGSVAWVKAQ